MYSVGSYVGSYMYTCRVDCYIRLLHVHVQWHALTCVDAAYSAFGSDVQCTTTCGLYFVPYHIHFR